MKPISKTKLLRNLYANAQVYRETAAYLFNVVAKNKDLEVHATHVAKKMQHRSAQYAQKAQLLEALDIDVIENGVF